MRRWDQLIMRGASPFVCQSCVCDVALVLQLVARQQEVLLIVGIEGGEGGRRE